MSSASNIQKNYSRFVEFVSRKRQTSAWRKVMEENLAYCVDFDIKDKSGYGTENLTYEPNGHFEKASSRYD